MISQEFSGASIIESPVRRELEKVLDPYLVEGADYIRKKIPGIFSSITDEVPKLIQTQTPSASGLAPTIINTREKDYDNRHRNRTIQEAVRRASFFDKFKAGDNFLPQAADHKFIVKNSLIQADKGEQPVQQDSVVARHMQKQTARAICVDESISMRGGGDILARLITTAYFLDCAENNLPLTVRHANRPMTGEKIFTADEQQSATMDSMLDMEKAADVAVHGYKPDKYTDFASGINATLSDLENTRIAPHSDSEIVFVTDCELDPKIDTQERIEHAVRLAKDKGVKIKIIHLKDDNVLPTGPDRLKKAGCEVQEINLSEILALPEKIRNKIIERTKIHMRQEEDVDLVEVYKRTIYWLTYLCGASAIYLTTGGALHYLSRSLDPHAGINIPPFGQNESTDAIHMLLGLSAGLQALTVLLRNRKAVFKLLDTIVDVPSVEDKLQTVKLKPPKEYMETVRYLERGSEIIIKGVKTTVKKGDRWEINGSVYEAI